MKRLITLLFILTLMVVPSFARGPHISIHFGGHGYYPYHYYGHPYWYPYGPAVVVVPQPQVVYAVPAPSIVLKNCKAAEMQIENKKVKGQLCDDQDGNSRFIKTQ